MLLIAKVEFYFGSCKKELTEAIKLLTADSTPYKDVFRKKGNIDFGIKKQ